MDVCKSCGRNANHWSRENNECGFCAASPYTTVKKGSDSETPPPSAQGILSAAKGHMIDREKTYDNQNGERSISKTVSAFNSITGHQLTPEQGWLFMGLLKMVRSQQGDFKLDNYEDMAAYAALMGEQAAEDRD